MNNDELKKMEKQLRIAEKEMAEESNMSKEVNVGKAINSSQLITQSSSTTTNKPDESQLDENTAVPDVEKKAQDTSVPEDESPEEEDDDSSSDSDSEAVPQEYRPPRLPADDSFLNILISIENYLETDLEIKKKYENEN